jgi:hypothetical protein
MFRTAKLSLTFALIATAQFAYCEPSEPPASTNTDPRQLVTMPDQAREIMRQDMNDHLAAINEIIAYLSENKLDAAAETAETRLGRSSMGKHRGSGMGPGRFMTPDMRNMGWAMHAAATEFAITAQKGDLASSYTAFQKITNSCVACHTSFRTQ